MYSDHTLVVFSQSVVASIDSDAFHMLHSYSFSHQPLYIQQSHHCSDKQTSASMHHHHHVYTQSTRMPSIKHTFSYYPVSRCHHTWCCLQRATYLGPARLPLPSTSLPSRKTYTVDPNKSSSSPGFLGVTILKYRILSSSSCSSDSATSSDAERPFLISRRACWRACSFWDSFGNLWISFRIFLYLWITLELMNTEWPNLQTLAARESSTRSSFVSPLSMFCHSRCAILYYNYD